MAKATKVISKRRKFFEVEIPLTKSTAELIGNSIEDVKDKNIKLDLTRFLKGKGIEATLKVKIENNKAVASPIKIKLMPYFLRRIMRKRISYVEDSFQIPSQESLLIIKPFLITRKKVSRAVRKTLRNQCKNWFEDYIKEKKDSEIFNEVLSNKIQKPLSLKLKKTYPLSFCEIRVLEIKRPLKPEEIPKKTKKTEENEEKESEKEVKIETKEIEKEIEDEKIKQAEEEIKQTQKKAVKKSEKEEVKEIEKEIKTKNKETLDKKTKEKKSNK